MTEIDLLNKIMSIKLIYKILKPIIIYRRDREEYLTIMRHKCKILKDLNIYLDT